MLFRDLSPRIKKGACILKKCARVNPFNLKQCVRDNCDLVFGKENINLEANTTSLINYCSTAQPADCC